MQPTLILHRSQHVSLSNILSANEKNWAELTFRIKCSVQFIHFNVYYETFEIFQYSMELKWKTPQWLFLRFTFTIKGNQNAKASKNYSHLLSIWIQKNRKILACEIKEGSNRISQWIWKRALRFKSLSRYSISHQCSVWPSMKILFFFQTGVILSTQASLRIFIDWWEKGIFSKTLEFIFQIFSLKVFLHTLTSRKNLGLQSQRKSISFHDAPSHHCVTTIQAESSSSKIYDLEIHKNLGNK